MRPQVTTVGPLVGGSATQIGLSQSPAAAGALALNGTSGSFTANNICASQSVSGASALVLNGALASGAPAVAWLPNPPSYIYLTSTGNDSSITFAVVGLDINNVAQTETLHGTNASVVASTKQYARILSITSSASTASTVTVGTMGTATVDSARRVILTSGGNDTGLTFTIYGTNWAGDKISEHVVGGSAAAVSSVLDYLTVTQVLTSGATATTVEVGTSGIAASPWINLDPWAPGWFGGQCVVSGTVNYDVEITMDDPDNYANPVAPSAMTWDSTELGVTSETGEKSFGLAYAPAWIRVLLNSGSGAVRMTIAQYATVPK